MPIERFTVSEREFPYELDPLERAAKVWKYRKHADLDAIGINNFAEYGQPASPYDGDGLFGHETVPDSANVIIEMPQLEVMTNGYGKNLVAESFPITTRFLNDVRPFPYGEYTLAYLVRLEA